MSDPRAIAAVTATLQQMIFQTVSADATLSGATVTTRPPDRARTEAGAGDQLNLFLYRTALDAAWRNQDPPGGPPGAQGDAPLPLILSYLLTAYGEDDDEVRAHHLLGLGMSVLHNRPVLSRDAIAAALAGTGLESQVERVRITPHPIPMDEISRLWATFQTGYRVSVTYDAAVVLIDSAAPVRVPMPVLARGPGDTGPAATAAAAPMLIMATAPDGRPTARPGDTITLIGRNLAAVSSVRLSTGRLQQPRTLVPDHVTDTAVHVTLPEADPVPAGPAGVSVVATVGGIELPAGAVALGLAPVLVSDAPIEATRVGGTARLQLDVAPPVVPDQSVQLFVGDRIVAAEPAAGPPTARTSLTFVLAGFDAATYVLRLCVDDQVSLPLADDGHSVDERQTLVLT